MPNQPKGKYAGGDYYGNAYTGFQPVSNYPQVFAPQDSGQSFAPFASANPYLNNYPTMGSLANSGNPAMVNAPQASAPSGAGILGTAVGAAAKLNPALATATGVLGAAQTIGGLIGLATTKEPEKYSLTSRNKAAIADAESQAKFGLSPQQISTATQGAREQLNTDIYNARNIAGNSASRAVFGLNRGMNLRSMNNLAVADFNAMDAKRRYRNSTYAMEQNIQDRNTGLDWQQYNQKQQAYGGAMRTGTQNLAGYFNLAQALKF